MILRWIPLRSVGPFGFGSPISQYYKKFCLKSVSDEYREKVGWNVYEVAGRDDLRIYAEEDRIEAVLCETSCLYEETNMIGMTVEEVISLLGTNPDSMETEELSEGPQEVYDFKDLGLQLWTQEGIIVTTICSDI